MNNNKGFTLIEIIVTITIIGVLSAIILFSITQYIAKGKDASVRGNLIILVPAGEKYYDANDGSGYQGLCSNAVVTTAFAAMPVGAFPQCKVKDDTFDAWAACAKEFSPINTAYCVDSRGVKKEISSSDCASPFAITQCP